MISRFFADSKRLKDSTFDGEDRKSFLRTFCQVLMLKTRFD